MSRRLIALLILTVSILTACGRAGVTHPAAAGYLIFLEGGFSNGAETVKVLDSGTGTVVRELPIGTPTSDWSRYYIATQLTGSVQLKAIDPASGQTIAQTTLPSGYNLPNIAFQGPTAGLSPNGQWLALTSQTRVATNFLVGSSALTDAFKTISVKGDFVFDALSNDGKSLYLIQKMKDPNHYQVRLYDVSAGFLMPQVVVDKREPNEPMNGIRGPLGAGPWPRWADLRRQFLPQHGRGHAGRPTAHDRADRFRRRQFPSPACGGGSGWGLCDQRRR